MIGITGSHRTGKSTLAGTFSEMSGMFMLETNVSDTFKRLGCSPKLNYNIDDRLFIQQQIMDDLELKYEVAPKYFVTDRTPIDVYSYMLCDIQRGDMNERRTKDMTKLWEDANRITQKYLRMIMLLQPGIELVEAEGKAPANEFYVEHVNSVMIGLLMSKCSGEFACNVVLLKRAMIDLRGRAETLMGFSRQYCPEFYYLQESSTLM